MEDGKIKMTYCCKDHQDAVGDWWRCGEAEGACPSCLRAHIAKLEAELATAQARIRETEEPDENAPLRNMAPLAVRVPRLPARPEALMIPLRAGEAGKGGATC